ncbi:hypothetical protein GpartN1_g1807.t1 [Galdieria partita]|uniref:O-fucosyltransferase family protein n=1 Tax=Galdieria partita TaxID=83374 RepID=A0A9C7UNZ4_9RHOD|nr:hypothetical protein GpartN1_g1804.t1 [Galdieria partita]GJQ10016.1 hypothetical protein GpartN1_g1807.t1 [Galdieria partita]
MMTLLFSSLHVSRRSAIQGFFLLVAGFFLFKLIKYNERQGVQERNVKARKPEKTLFVSGWYGQLNNNLLLIIHAMFVGSLINRKIVCSNHDMFDFFDFSLFEEHGMFVEPGNSLNDTIKLTKLRGILSEDPAVLAMYSSNESPLEITAEEAFFACLTPTQNKLAFSLLRWKRKQLESLRFILHEIGLVEGNFVAVHLRNLDLTCDQYITNYPTWIANRIRFSCPWNATTVYDILSSLQVSNTPLFLSSDGQVPSIDQEFFKKGAISLHNLSSELQIPSRYVDLFVISEAKYLFGNFISTFSNNAASMLLTKYPKHEIIFSFPPICKNGVEFWNCHRYAFWCI